MSETEAADAAEEFTEELEADIWADEPAGPSLISKMLAEVAGTFILVLLGVGTAITLSIASRSTLFLQSDSGGYQPVGYSVVAPTLTVGLAFGVSVIIAAVVFGGVSGAHLNPAVTVGVWLAGRFPGRDVVPYVLAQVIGGLFAGLTIFYLAGTSTIVADRGAAMESVSNGYGDHSPGGFSLTAALIVEALITGGLVLAVLGATKPSASKAAAPFVIGSALAFMVVLGIPFTNAAVNPARATSTALFAGDWAFAQLWVFWVAPIVGAAIVGLLWRAFAPVEEIEVVETIEVIEA
jgi:aquaporin Z